MHHIFRIRHLLYMLRRDKTNRIDMAKSRLQQALVVGDLFLRGNELFESLPRITRAFDYFDIHPSLASFHQ